MRVTLRYKRGVPQLNPHLHTSIVPPSLDYPPLLAYSSPRVQLPKCISTHNVFLFDTYCFSFNPHVCPRIHESTLLQVTLHLHASRHRFKLPHSHVPPHPHRRHPASPPLPARYPVPCPVVEVFVPHHAFDPPELRIRGLLRFGQHQGRVEQVEGLVLLGNHERAARVSTHWKRQAQTFHFLFVQCTTCAASSPLITTRTPLFASC